MAPSEQDWAGKAGARRVVILRKVSAWPGERVVPGWVSLQVRGSPVGVMRMRTLVLAASPLRMRCPIQSGTSSQYFRR